MEAWSPAACVVGHDRPLSSARPVDHLAKYDSYASSGVSVNEGVNIWAVWGPTAWVMGTTDPNNVRHASLIR